MIELDKINLFFDRHSPIIEGVSLEIPQGNFCWLTGPSGAGKSTFLRMLHLEIKPSSGHLEILGVNTTEARRSNLCRLRQHIGMIHQDFKLLPNLSVFDNVSLVLRLQNHDNNYIQQQTTKILEWLGLGNKLNAFPHTLSGGEQQRVAIGRAVIHRPELLLADEPTNALDESQAQHLMNLFHDLNDVVGSTIIVATHNEGLIRQFPAPRLRIYNKGLWADHVF